MLHSLLPFVPLRWCQTALEWWGFRSCLAETNPVNSVARSLNLCLSCIICAVFPTLALRCVTFYCR